MCSKDLNQVNYCLLQVNSTNSAVYLSGEGHVGFIHTVHESEIVISFGTKTNVYIRKNKICN